jgi:hypothetical protein
MAFPLWVLGIILIIAGSLGNNLGNNLVSLDHAQKREDCKKKKRKTRLDSTDYNDCEQAETDRNENSEIGSPKKEDETAPRKSYRVIGTVIFIFGNLFTFGSFGFGAQSLLASLESIQFVSNLFFAKYVHKETCTRRMMVATLSIIVGNVLVVIFSVHQAKVFTSNQMIHLYVVNTGYHAYMVLAFFIWLVIFFHDLKKLKKTEIFFFNFLGDELDLPALLS